MEKQKKRRKRLPTEVIDKLERAFPNLGRGLILSRLFHNDIEIVKAAARFKLEYDEMKARTDRESMKIKNDVLYSYTTNVPS